MSPSTGYTQDMDRSRLVTYVEDPGQRYLFHYGEGFRYERLPVGSRVIYPPPPLPPLEDVDAAIDEALDNPLGMDPLSAHLRPGMKVTIAFDDVSLPLPPMRRPDIRQRVIEKVLKRLGEAGVEDIHLVAALGLHRRMTASELRHVVGDRVFKAYYPDRLYNHDAEDRENMVELGKTDLGEVVEVPRRIAESDLLIYVNLNLVPMDGGHKSIHTGLITYRTLRHHHNVHALLHTALMDPSNSALHDSCVRMGAVTEAAIKVFKIETTVNSDTFIPLLRHLQLPEWEWRWWDKAVFHTNRTLLSFTPFAIKHKIFHSMRAPYGVTSVQAGATDPVHARTLEHVFRQQLVPVQGQADVLIAGVPYLGPYNVGAPLNPILVHCLTLGYLFNLYRGKPLLRRGGVLVLLHPLENRFHPVHHATYIDFYNEVLAQTRDPAEMERGWEEAYANNPRYIELYRNSYAYHGAHPFYMWYWGCHGQDHVGRVIVVGAKDGSVAQRLGYEAAPSLEAALEMAQETVGRSPQITTFHWAPIFMCDVTEG